MALSIDYQNWQARAKVDYITIALPTAINTLETARNFINGCAARVEWPKTWDRWGKHSCPWVTLHDPSRASLQYLIDSYPDIEILELEFAVDLFPNQEGNNAAELGAAHHWLRWCLFPQKHPQMNRVHRRKVYDRRDGKIKPDASAAYEPWMGTVYWPTQTAFQQVRCYIKTSDNGKPIAKHSVRVEVTLNRGGCQDAEIPKLHNLPVFAEDMRRYLSPFFYVAAGIKSPTIRVRTKNEIRQLAEKQKVELDQQNAKHQWECFGAAICVKRDLLPMPDRQANRLIGSALNELRRDLLKLELPKKRGKPL